MKEEIVQIEEDFRTRGLKKVQQESVVSSIKQKYEAYAEIEIGKTLDKMPLYQTQSTGIQIISSPKPDRSRRHLSTHR